VYGAFGTMTWENHPDASTMFEIGFSMKPRFPLAGGAAAIKPGINIGYRHQSNPQPAGDKIGGLALDLSVEIQFQSSGIIPYIEVGFLSQPLGSNDYDDWDFPPMPYVGAGVAF
jgi:hypothetical protein